MRRPCCCAAIKNFFRIRDVEVAALAENVAAFGQLFLGYARQHLVDDERDILLGRAAKLFRNGVCAEKRRHKFDRRFRIQPANHAQNLQLVLHGQPIAGLCFDRCGSSLQKPKRMFLRLREKFVLRRGPRLANGRANPASARRDFLVSRASRSHLEFIHAIPGKDRMRVRVDESRQDHATSRIDDFRIVRQIAFDFFRSSDGRDQAVPHQHSAVGNDR